MAIIYPEGTLSEIINIAQFSDSTYNIETSNTSDTAVLSFSYSRQNSGSHLIVNGYAPCLVQHSYKGGAYIRANGVKHYHGTNFISPEDNGGTDGPSGVALIAGYFTATELGSTTGNITIEYGWTTRDGSQQRCAGYYNQQNKSSRARESTTHLLIMEIMNPTFIT